MDQLLYWSQLYRLSLYLWDVVRLAKMHLKDEQGYGYSTAKMLQVFLVLPILQ